MLGTTANASRAPETVTRILNDTFSLAVDHCRSVDQLAFRTNAGTFSYAVALFQVYKNPRHFMANVLGELIVELPDPHFAHIIFSTKVQRQLA